MFLCLPAIVYNPFRPKSRVDLPPSLCLDVIASHPSRLLLSSRHLLALRPEMSKKCSTMKCSARCLFILQLLLLTLRQVFDFMGHMWVPILFNFVAIIAVIIGLFGLQQLRQTYLTLYAAFQLFSIGWNLFVCAFYFNLGSLNRESSHLLNFGTGSRSWWFENGPDCVVHFEPIVLNVSLSSPPLHQAAAAVSNAYQPSNDGEHSLNGAIHSFPFLAPVKVTNCAVDYYLIEGGQAIIHCLVSVSIVSSR